MSPMQAGRNGRRPLAGGVEQALGGQAPAAARSARVARRCPRPGWRRRAGSACRGRGRTTACRAPPPGCLRRPPGRRRARARSAVSCRDTSAAGSRSTRNAVPVPGRAVTWASWPSTQTAPSRSTHAAILRATVWTGQGASADVAGSPVLTAFLAAFGARLADCCVHWFARRARSRLGDRGDPVGEHRHVRGPVAVRLLPGQQRAHGVVAEVAQLAAELGMVRST